MKDIFIRFYCEFVEQAGDWIRKVSREQNVVTLAGLEEMVEAEVPPAEYRSPRKIEASVWAKIIALPKEVEASLRFVNPEGKLIGWHIDRLVAALPELVEVARTSPFVSFGDARMVLKTANKPWGSGITLWDAADASNVMLLDTSVPGPFVDLPNHGCFR